MENASQQVDAMAPCVSEVTTNELTSIRERSRLDPTPTRSMSLRVVRRTLAYDSTSRLYNTRAITTPRVIARATGGTSVRVITISAANHDSHHIVNGMNMGRSNESY
jgi:hypothetical protein